MDTTSSSLSPLSSSTDKSASERISSGSTSSSGTTSTLKPNVVDRAAQKAHEVIDQVAANAGPTVEKLYDAANKVQTKVQAKAKDLSNMEDRVANGARDYIRERPLTTLAVGAAIGWLIGRLGR